MNGERSMHLIGAAEVSPDPVAEAVAKRLVVPRLATVHVVLAAVLLDIVTLALAYWFAQFAAVPRLSFDPLVAVLPAIAAAAAGIVATIGLGGHSLDRIRYPARGLGRLAAGSVAGALVLVALVPGAPGSALVTAAALSCAALALPARLPLGVAVDWAVAAGLTGRRAIIAGGGPEAERVVRGLAARHDNDIRVHAVFDDRGRERVGERVLDVLVIGRFEDLVAFCRTAEIDLILLTLPPTAEARIAMLLEKFRVLPVQVHLTAWSRDLRFPDSAANPAAGLLLPPSFRPERRVVKRTFDLVVGGAALLVLSPVMLLAACAVLCDSPGPVFFRQRRHGFNDREIEVWKFRTMYRDRCDQTGRAVVTRGDPRVTRVGRVLRKTSLDELPQLFNVLTGTLSLVGPRPHVLDARSSRQEAFEQIVDGYSARHRLPPGITGWAQINGHRGEVEEPESLRARIDHDLYYIENWSLWLDLAILLRTPMSLLNTSRAY